MVGRTVGRHVADQRQATRQRQARHDGEGARHDRFQRSGLGATVRPRREPRVGIVAKQKQMVMAGPLAQDAGRQEDAPRFLEQNARARLGVVVDAEREADPINAPAVVRQMVRRVAVAEVFQVFENVPAVIREKSGRLGRVARQAVARGEGENVDRPLGGGVGMPGPTVAAPTETARPRAPHGVDPGRFRFLQRQPGEPMQRQFGFRVGEGARHRRVLGARRHDHGFARQRQGQRARRRGRAARREGDPAGNPRSREPGDIEVRRRRAADVGAPADPTQEAADQPAPKHGVGGDLFAFSQQRGQHGRYRSPADMK